MTSHLPNCHHATCEHNPKWGCPVCICVDVDTPPSSTEWEKEFRGKWEGANLYSETISSAPMNEMIEDIRSLLSTSIKNREREIREKVEGMIEELAKEQKRCAKTGHYMTLRKLINKVEALGEVLASLSQEDAQT